MKRYSLVLGLALVLMTGPALAADYDLAVDNYNPPPGQITVTLAIDNWAGTQLKTFDTCLKYDSSVLSVNSMQINDTSVGGCAAAAFSITNDNGTDCARLGGGIFPGTTCNVADDYVLATVVFDVLTEDVTDLCVGDCTATTYYFPCSHDFTDYVEDETGMQYPSRVCIVGPPDTDGDLIPNYEDNCPYQCNSPFRGTCAETIGTIVKGTGVICLSDNVCGIGEVCQMNQEDCNGNGIGDACECYADFDKNGDVFPSDLSVFLDEYGRTDCLTTPPPCQADIDGDGNVYPGDLSVFLKEYGRVDCPVVE